MQSTHSSFSNPLSLQRITLHSVLVLSLALTSCQTVPITGRKQVNWVPASDEVKLGLTEFTQMKSEVPISRDPKVNEMVTRVGRRIAAVAASDMPNAQWEFVVFESKEANAFCLPGGKVGVYTGILPITRDEAGLATVIGHEVAHAIAHHGAERMTEQQGLGLAGAALGVAFSGTKYESLIGPAYGLGTQLGVALPHSRKQESEADHIGLIYMARAGYPPSASVEFWERFAAYNEKQGGGTLWFLRTHPLDNDRIANLKKLLPEAEAQYRRAK